MGPLGKLSCMWEDGIYLGVKGTTGEMIVGDQKGVWRTRTVRRKTLAERWTRENLEMVGGRWRCAVADGRGRWRGSEVGGDGDGRGCSLENKT